MRTVKQNISIILNELASYLEKIEDEQLEEFVEAILAAERIFVAGAGRSGLAIRAFANRLMHLGLTVNIVGELTATYAREGDLLIIGSGSGETQSMVAIAENAKKRGLKLALNTIDPTSTLGKLADVKLVLPGASPKVVAEDLIGVSPQPMGSSFEQFSFLLYDAMIMRIMDLLQETSESMFLRHANLE